MCCKRTRERERKRESIIDQCKGGKVCLKMAKHDLWAVAESDKQSISSSSHDSPFMIRERRYVYVALRATLSELSSNFLSTFSLLL
jgi:hypothetical protein